jgi:thioredoxin 1
MRLMDRSVAFLLLAILLASCTPTPERSQENDETTSLPRLIDLGSTQCIPCKRMAPILEGMKQDYSGIVDIEFIDVRRDAAAGMIHAVRIIPTQVFLDRSGKEVFRHEGFFSREEMEAILRDSLGVAIVPASEAGSATVPSADDSTGTDEASDDFFLEGTM